MRWKRPSRWVEAGDSGRVNPVGLLFIGVLWTLGSFAPWIEYHDAERLAKEPLLQVRDVHWAVDDGIIEDVYVRHPTLGEHRVPLAGIPQKMHTELESGMQAAPHRSPLIQYDSDGGIHYRAWPPGFLRDYNDSREYEAPLIIRHDRYDLSQRGRLAMAETDVQNPTDPVAMTVLTLCGAIPIVIAVRRLRDHGGADQTIADDGVGSLPGGFDWDDGGGDGGD